MPQKPLPAEATEAEIGQARKMEIVGRLTGGAVHDFNNILTVITGTIEILAEAVADRPQLAAIARLIGQAAARGANLTAHLLAFAHGQPSQPRKVDVTALLADAARLLRPTLGEQIEIDTVPATEVPFVVIDPHQLMTVILNLAINARDAMPEGGKLALETGNVVIEESGAGAGADGKIVAGFYVTIAVSAFGHGISADAPERVFADLRLVLDIIRQSNGHIETCSEAGGGTTVRIYLPRAADVAQSQAKNSNEARIEGGDEAILIVEDDLMVREYVITQVESLGYRALDASSASRALAIIDEGRKIDLLFTDVIMPGSINGRQLAVEALHRRPSLKILYTSGYTQSSMLRDGRLDAGALLLSKPYRKIDLAKMIRTALTT